MTYILFVKRFFSGHRFEFDTLQAAAKTAVGQLDADQSYPDKILGPGGEVVWEQDGPFGSQLEKLREMAKVHRA